MSSQNTELKSIKKILEICGDGISKESKALLVSAADTDVAVKELCASGMSLDAVAVLSAALTPQASIYWAWCCLSHYISDKLDEQAGQCLQCVESWLSAEYSPADGIKAWQASEVEEEASAAGWLCKGVYWTGDNVVPPQIEVQQKIQPPEGLSNKMSALAIQLCAYLCDPGNPQSVCGQCVELGNKIACGEMPKG